MTRKRYQFIEERESEIKEHWRLCAQNMFVRTALKQEQRLEQGVAVDLSPKTGIWAFLCPEPRQRRRYKRRYERWHCASWLDLVQQPERQTHYFSFDEYPIQNEPKRHRLTWSKGSWGLGDLHDRIEEDHALTCDGLHLWMWTCVRNNPYNYACHWYVERQLKTVLSLPKYQRLFETTDENMVKQALLTYHIGAGPEYYDMYKNEAQARRRARKKGAAVL